VKLKLDITLDLVGMMKAEAPVRPIEVGDDFSVVAGCDERLETCRDRFANVVNFRGFPHIPGQDTVIRYPNRGDANSGEVL
jgi:uncharacterized phage protein (TIGR02218 family)